MAEFDQTEKRPGVPLRTHWFMYLWFLLFAILATGFSGEFTLWWNNHVTEALYQNDDRNLGQSVRLVVLGAPAWIVHYLSQSMLFGAGIYGVFVVLRTITNAPMRRWIDL